MDISPLFPVVVNGVVNDICRKIGMAIDPVTAVAVDGVQGNHRRD